MLSGGREGGGVMGPLHFYCMLETFYNAYNEQELACLLMIPRLIHAVKILIHEDIETGGHLGIESF